jgi:cytochrome P450
MLRRWIRRGTVEEAGVETELQDPAFPIARDPKCPFDPAPELREWARDSRVKRVRLWSGKTAYVILRHADQLAVLSNPTVSANTGHPNFPHALPSTKVLKAAGRGVLVSLDNPDHGVVRRMLTRDFMVKAAERRREGIQHIVDDLLDTMLAGPKPADYISQFALALPSLVICDLLGVPNPDYEFFQHRSDLMLSANATEGQAVTALSELHGYLGELVDRKATTPGDDLISRLAECMGHGELTREEVVTTGVFLLIAGHETTANMIGTGTLALLQNPQQLDQVRATDDPKVVANAVEELLRYLHTPHSGITRVALEDITVGDEVIPAGSGLILTGNVADRDPAVFPDHPDELDINRSARQHVAFGFGIHQCLGQSLARIELQVVFSTVFKKIPTLALAVPFDTLRFKIDSFTYGVRSMPITW